MGFKLPCFDAVLGSEGAINRFRRRGDADAVDERGGHDFNLLTNPISGFSVIK
jgi:hypothetical protein